jgi:hypothetical protein
MENRDSFLPSAELSATRPRTEGTPQLSVASAACKGYGELENTFRSAGRSYFNPCEAKTSGSPTSLFAISRGGDKHLA